MQRYSPWTVIFYAFLFAAVSWHIIYPPFQYLKTGHSLSQWGWLLYISVPGTVIPFALFIYRGKFHPIDPCQHYGNPGTDLSRVFCLFLSR